MRLRPPDVFLGGEEDDGASLPGVQQEVDDLVKVGGVRVDRDLQRLGDADSACRRGGRAAVNNSKRRPLLATAFNSLHPADTRGCCSESPPTAGLLAAKVAIAMCLSCVLG